jgi:hypothetical protein
VSSAESLQQRARRGTVSCTVYALSAGAALLGGALLSAIALMSVASIVPRTLGLQPIQGDFELVQVGLAVCVLLPWCQRQGRQHHRFLISDFLPGILLFLFLAISLILVRLLS